MFLNIELQRILNANILRTLHSMDIRHFCNVFSMLKLHFATLMQYSQLQFNISEILIRRLCAVWSWNRSELACVWLVWRLFFYKISSALKKNCNIIVNVVSTLRNVDQKNVHQKNIECSKLQCLQDICKTL